MRILALLSHLLGNRALSQRLHEGLQSLPGVNIFVVTLETGDYLRFPAPRLVRRSGSLESEAVFRAKLGSLAIPDYDAVIANGFGLLNAAGPLLKRVPSALATDTTPALQFRQKELPKEWWKRAVLHGRQQLADRAFIRMASRVAVFLPMSAWCAESLGNDYGVRGRPVFVTSCPQRDILDDLPERPSRDRFQLVFVGNDFRRKGGDLLLSLYRGYLRDHCELQVVSNDPLLTNMELPEGVTVTSGLRDSTDILPIYRAGDLLVLPTKQDQYPQVICEGFSQGLPCIASAVGGIPEILTKSGAGILLPENSPDSLWAKAILDLAADRAAHDEARHRALCFAKETLSTDRFRETIRSVLQEFRIDR